jgi:hypothetical protein
MSVRRDSVISRSSYGPQTQNGEIQSLALLASRLVDRCSVFQPHTRPGSRSPRNKEESRTLRYVVSTVPGWGS